MQKTPVLRIVISLSVGLVTFGLAPIMVRLASADPFAIAMVRTLGAVALLAPFYWVRPASTRTPFNGREGLMFALAGLSLGLHFLLWTVSLSYTTVASASVLVNVHPVLLITLERVLFRYRFAAGVWIGVLLAFAGSVMLGVTDQTASVASHPVLGNTLAVLSASAFVVYILIGQQLRKKAGWLEYVFPVYTWAAACCTVIFLVIRPEVELSSAFWLASLGLALGPQLLGHGSMNYAVKYVQPTMLSMTILAEPILATLIAVYLFAEVPAWPSVCAMLVIVGGLMVAWRSRIRQLVA